MKISQRWVIIILAGYLVLTMSLFYLSTAQDPPARAVARMSWGLVILWVVGGGLIMYRWRDQIKIFVQNVQQPWPLKFILFATLLAMVEEMVTTLMTNLAPFFGSRVGEAYITASTNYFDVIFFHSVIVFIPMFCVWAWLLKKYSFSPFAVFILFGLTGTIAEVIYGGLQNFLQFSFWIFIYGLMIFLPAYTLPEERGARPPRIRHYFLAIFLPFVLVPVTAWIPFVLNHPRIHF